MTIIEIGQRIKTVRLEKELTLQDIADSTGLNKSTIQRYERGLIEKIKLPVIESIARSIGVSPSWLVGKSDEKEIINRIEIGLTQHEHTHIKKYRTLDERGKTHVDNTLETEYQYVLKQQEPEEEEEYEPRVIAAHLIGDYDDEAKALVETLKKEAKSLLNKK